MGSDGLLHDQPVCGSRCRGYTTGPFWAHDDDDDDDEVNAPKDSTGAVR